MALLVPGFSSGRMRFTPAETNERAGADGSEVDFPHDFGP